MEDMDDYLDQKQKDISAKKSNMDQAEKVRVLKSPSPSNLKKLVHLVILREAGITEYEGFTYAGLTYWWF